MTRSRGVGMRWGGCILALGFLMGWAHAQSAFGAIRFAHQSPDAPLVDVLVDGRAALRDVPFGSVSRYLLLATGRHEIAIFPHRLPAASAAAADAEDGEEPEEPGVAALEPVVTFVTVEEGAYYTAVLTGFYEPPADEAQLGHLSIAVSPDQAQFTLSGPRGYAAEFVGDQLISGLQPGTYTIMATEEGYARATYEVDIGPRKTTTVSIALQEEESEDPADTPPVVEGDPSRATGALELQTFRDAFGGVPDAASARIRIIHASPTSPSLTVVASRSHPEGEERDDPDAPVEVGSLGYPGASEYVALAAGTYTLSYLVQANGQALIELTGLEILPGEIYTFILTSDTTGSRPRVVPVVDAMVVRDGDAR